MPTASDHASHTIAETSKPSPPPSVAAPCTISCIVVGSVTFRMFPELSYVMTGSRFARYSGDASAVVVTSARRTQDETTRRAFRESISCRSRENGGYES